MKSAITDPHIRFTNIFNKQRKKAPLDIKIVLRETLELFHENPNHPQLRNHALTKKLSSFRSIDITGDWRAIFSEREMKNRKIITFHKIGTHKDLYGKK